MYALEFTLFKSDEPYLEVFACSTLFLGETITPQNTSSHPHLSFVGYLKD